MYHYLGNERLQFYFFSPNICAAFLVVTALLTAGVFLFTVKRKGAWPKVGAGFLGIAFLLQLVMIAVTYSRGGYVACFIALTAAALFSRKRWSLVLPILFLVVLLCTSSGASRIQSIGQIRDGSIRNRFLLWHYGPGVIAKNWATGTTEPGIFYTKYYQPLWLNEGYSTLINDSLTIAAIHGIFTLFAVLTIALLLFQYGFRLWLVTRNELLLYALAALSAYVIAGCFTTCYRFPSILILLGILAALIIGFLICGIVKKKFRLNKFDYWSAPALAGLICAIILIYGSIVNTTLAYSWKSQVIEDRKMEILIPRQNSRGTCFALSSPNGDNFRTVLRPLIEAGFTVISVPIDGGFGELPLAERMIASFSEDNAFLIGIGEARAIQAIALSDTVQASAVVAVNPPFDWPFDELSPQVQLPKTKNPVFLFLSEQKEEEEKAFQTLIKNSGIFAKTFLLSDAQLNDMELIMSKTMENR